MATYVDALVTYPDAVIKPVVRRFGNRWAHMTADSEAELHAMARRIGVPRSAYQGDYPRAALRHYDLIPSKRRLAVKAGAVEVDARTHLWARVQAEIAAETQQSPLPALGTCEWCGREVPVAALYRVPWPEEPEHRLVCDRCCDNEG
jgi:hypothetical protein